ncbi:hypothetical protein JW935_01255 [candidate division KSB1 bacterium]|nr:hypothetical protein [candidate division KSB1 bacterium]
MKNFFLFYLVLVIFVRCSDTKNPVKPEGNGIEFYFLNDTTLTLQEALEKDMKSLTTQSTPWLTSDDISIYDFSTHFIYLKGDKEKYIPELKNHNDESLVPFVLKTKNQPVFVGALYTRDIAFVPNCPAIGGLIAFAEMFPKDVIHLSHFLPRDQRHNDPRNNQVIKDALIESSIFHGGITLTLDSVAVTENSDTSTVSYTFTYENNDMDDLYVLDPNLTTTSVFQCFSSGIIFRDSTWNTIIPTYQDGCFLDFPFDFNSGWFVKVGAHEKLSRTVRSRGYPYIPAGHYRCDFYMTCVFRIELPQRYYEGGRYWLGYLESNQKEFSF